MSVDLDQTLATITSAFEERPSLRDTILKIARHSKSATATTAFLDIANYVTELRRSSEQQGNAEAPAGKKRKLDGDVLVNGQGRSGGDSLNGSWSGTVLEGVSFSVPQRKKFSLEIAAKQGVRALNSSTKETEFGVPWTEADQIVCLPVPDKAQASRNFIVFPKNGDGLSRGAENSPSYEPLVWTGTDTLPKGADEKAETQAGSMLRTLKEAGVTVQEPTEDEFASEIPQAHRKGEKAYHIKAFQGSKDGYLFFLPNGIVWGFKKPLIYFSFATIDSVSYTSILQRTFNLNIAARPATSEDEPQEFEFSMIDQADFAGIDAYVKKHDLQDASMAEQRRAKKLNINAPRGQKAEDVPEGEEESELQKANREAEMQADDDEDESDDENFDPGSEGESEGSGSSDEESQDGGEQGGKGGDEDDDEDEDDEM